MSDRPRTDSVGSRSSSDSWSVVENKKTIDWDATESEPEDRDDEISLSGSELESDIEEAEEAFVPSEGSDVEEVEQDEDMEEEEENQEIQEDEEQEDEEQDSESEEQESEDDDNMSIVDESEPMQGAAMHYVPPEKIAKELDNLSESVESPCIFLRSIQDSQITIRAFFVSSVLSCLFLLLVTYTIEQSWLVEKNRICNVGKTGIFDAAGNIYPNGRCISNPFHRPESEEIIRKFDSGDIRLEEEDIIIKYNYSVVEEMKKMTRSRKSTSLLRRKRDNSYCSVPSIPSLTQPSFIPRPPQPTNLRSKRDLTVLKTICSNNFVESTITKKACVSKYSTVPTLRPCRPLAAPLPHIESKYRGLFLNDSGVCYRRRPTPSYLLPTPIIMPAMPTGNPVRSLYGTSQLMSSVSLLTEFPIYYPSEPIVRLTAQRKRSPDNQSSNSFLAKPCSGLVSYKKRGEDVTGAMRSSNYSKLAKVADHLVSAHKASFTMRSRQHFRKIEQCDRSDLKKISLDAKKKSLRIAYKQPLPCRAPLKERNITTEVPKKHFKKAKLEKKLKGEKKILWTGKNHNEPYRFEKKRNF